MNLRNCLSSVVRPWRTAFGAGCVLSVAGGLRVLESTAPPHLTRDGAGAPAAKSAGFDLAHALRLLDTFDATPARSPIDWSAQPWLAAPTSLADIEVALALATPTWAQPPPPHNDCSEVAFVTWMGVQQEAHADLTLGVAKCLNGDGTFGRCWRDLQAEYREARALAREQYEARLDVCRLLGGGNYNPEINPGDFSANVTNRFFPLVVGRTLVYRKVTGEGVEEVRVTARPQTNTIGGVDCRLVRDVVTLDGELIEDTDDWYAQHRNGDVWYFGEVARNFEDGLLDNLDGSWRTGKEGALAGMQMKARPRPGNAYRQEFLLNEAEDLAVVLGLDRTVTVAYGTFRDCLETKEFTPMEPDVEEHKFYAPGLGFVLATNARGERTELVQVIDP